MCAGPDGYLYVLTIRQVTGQLLRAGAGSARRLWATIDVGGGLRIVELGIVFQGHWG